MGTEVCAGFVCTRTISNITEETKVGNLGECKPFHAMRYNMKERSVKLIIIFCHLLLYSSFWKTVI